MAYKGIEARLVEAGVDVGTYLRDLYEVQRKTYRQLMVVLGTTSHEAVGRLLRKHGIRIRKGGEAIAVQWAGNVARRERARARMRQTVAGITESNGHWALGHTKETHLGIASAASKLAERRWLSQPDVIRKSMESSKKAHRLDPNTHSQASRKLTKAEAGVAAWLARHGLECVPQSPVIVGDALYFADFLVPSLNLVVEVSKSSGRVPVERIRDFRKVGLETLAITNTVPISGRWHHADEAIARAKVGQFHPSTVRECWVSPRASKGNRKTQAYFDQLIG